MSGAYEHGEGKGSGLHAEVNRSSAAGGASQDEDDADDTSTSIADGKAAADAAERECGSVFLILMGQGSDRGGLVGTMIDLFDTLSGIENGVRGYIAKSGTTVVHSAPGSLTSMSEASSYGSNYGLQEQHLHQPQHRKMSSDPLVRHVNDGRSLIHRHDLRRYFFL